MAEKEKRQYNRPRTIAIPADGRLQPQAIDLEEAVIGAILLEQDAYPIVSDILKPEYFYDSRHQKIYQAVVDLSIHEKPIDILTVTDQLQKAGQLEEVGGAVYLSQLSNKVASGSHIEYHGRSFLGQEKRCCPEIIQQFTSSVCRSLGHANSMYSRRERLSNPCFSRNGSFRCCSHPRHSC